jgi:hypothetical protein
MELDCSINAIFGWSQPLATEVLVEKTGIFVLKSLLPVSDRLRNLDPSRKGRGRSSAFCIYTVQPHIWREMPGVVSSSMARVL